MVPAFVTGLGLGALAGGVLVAARTGGLGARLSGKRAVADEAVVPKKVLVVKSAPVTPPRLSPTEQVAAVRARKALSTPSPS